MSLHIYYMWGFKPNEKEIFFNVAKNTIQNNNRYVAKQELITPQHVPRLLTESEKEFPGITDLYNKIPEWVTKSDLIRVLKVYHDGGTYCDADCFIKKSFDQHTKDNNVVVFTEYIIDNVDVLGPRECKNPENKLRVANYFFFSKSKKHPFFHDVITECVNRLNQILIKEDMTSFAQADTLWSCGPDVITSVYHTKKNKYDDLFLCDTSFLYHLCNGSWRADN